MKFQQILLSNISNLINPQIEEPSRKKTKMPRKKDFTDIVQKNKQYISLSVCLKNGYDNIQEQAVETLAKKMGGIVSGAGFSFLTGDRDIGIFFPTKPKAKNFLEKAVTLNLIKKIVHISEAHLDWQYTDSKKTNYNKV